MEDNQRAISRAEINARILEFMRSEAREIGIKGHQYYRVQNDILVEKKRDIITGKADERLAHSTYRNIVDEKVSFLLSKPPVITIGKMEDEELRYKDFIVDQLGKQFQKKMIMLGVEASNKAVAWLQPFIDENGKLGWHVHDSSNIIPIWSDKQERLLEYVIQLYEEEVFDEKTETFIIKQKVAVHDEDKIDYYEYDGPDLDFIGQSKGYITLDGKPYSWGKIPFIPFFNNQDELADIQLVKSLIDAYDIGRSEGQNVIEDIRQFILVLKGYRGDNLDRLVSQIKQYGAIAIDSDNAGVESISASMNIADTLNHFTLLKRDIWENAQAVNKDIGSLGANPTNLTLKFLFAGLGLKADKLETEFKAGFNDMIEFIKIYAAFKNVPVLDEDVEILFNRDMAMNESELIKDINASQDLSLKTRLEMHPYVSDVKDELEKIEAEKEPLNRPVDIEKQISDVEIEDGQEKE